MSVNLHFQTKKHMLAAKHFTQTTWKNCNPLITLGNTWQPPNVSQC